MVESGTHAELAAKEGGEYTHMLSFDQTRGANNKDNNNDDFIDKSDQDDNKEKKTLRQNSVVSGTFSTDEDDEENEKTADLEADVEDAGWDVMVKYMKVSH